MGAETNPVSLPDWSPWQHRSCLAPSIAAMPVPLLGAPWSDLTPPSATWLAAPRRAGRRPPPTAPVARAFCSTWTPARLRARACPLVATRHYHQPPHAMLHHRRCRLEQSRAGDGSFLKKGHRMEIRIRNIPQTSVIQSNDTLPMPPDNLILEQFFFWVANVRTAQLVRLPNNSLAAVLELPSKFKTNKINKLFPSEKK